MVDSLGCPVALNDGPQHVVIKAALRALAGWAAGGDPPPTSEPLEVDDAGARCATSSASRSAASARRPSTSRRRSSAASLPTGGPVVCSLSGTTTPIDPATLAERYDSLDAYLEEFEAAADAAIEAGFVLPEDREALLDMADPSTLGG